MYSMAPASVETQEPRCLRSHYDNQAGWAGPTQSPAPAWRTLSSRADGRSIMRLRACGCACAGAVRALGAPKGSSRRRGRRSGRRLLRSGAAAAMPGIVELPTLEELKVQEVRLVRKTGTRGLGLRLPGPGPSPADPGTRVAPSPPRSPNPETG